MPIKSLITYPQTALNHNLLSVNVRGHAWAGDKKVKEVQKV